MDRRILLYIATVVVAAIWFTVWHQPIAQLRGFTSADWEIIAFIFVGVVSQAAAIDFGSGRQANSSLAFIPFLAVAIVKPPFVSLLVAAAVIGISEIFFTRRGLLKGSFNVAQLVIALGVGSHAYHRLAAENPAAGVDIIAFIALVLAFFSINLVLSSIGLSLYRSQPFLPTLRDVAGPRGGNLLYDIFFSTVVVVTVILYHNLGYWGIILITVPLLLIRHFYLQRRKLEEANRDLLTALVTAIETRDPYTSGHSKRVETLARLIAQDMGLSSRTVEKIGTAALLHDVGKIDPVYSYVISKPHSLTEDERQLIQTHAARGAELLKSMSSLDASIVASVRHHHERYDGKGYPDGIAGEAIPLAARIIMVCDSIDAMLSDRPYRSALGVPQVRGEIEACAGSQFDPNIVRVVLSSQTLERAITLVHEWRARAAEDTSRVGSETVAS